MKEIVPKNSRYIPFTQQKSSCVPASISMVMYRLGIPLVPQELLGYHLGLIVSPENKKLFWKARSGKRPKSGYGTRVSEYNPDQAFRKLKIPLKMVYYPISKFQKLETFKKYIIEAVRKDKNVLICYDWGEMNNTKEHDGHVSVLDRVMGSSVRFIDPSSIQPKWRTVSFNKLKKAIEVHGDEKRAGFWELIKI
jgi:hypothetical protein